MTTTAYVKLATVLTQSAEETNAHKLRAALTALPQRPFSMTLDLLDSKNLFPDAEVESLVQVIKDSWPSPAWCFVNCDNPIAWSRAAASLSQPLLSWRAFVRREGYQVLGQTPSGRYATLLRVLCTTHLRATAEQLAHDPSIVSPHKLNVDSCSLQQWMLRGQPPMGLTTADVSQIANDLRNMALRRYIVAVSQGMFSVVDPPTPPSWQGR